MISLTLLKVLINLMGIVVAKPTLQNLIQINKIYYFIKIKYLQKLIIRIIFLVMAKKNRFNKFLQIYTIKSGILIKIKKLN